MLDLVPRQIVSVEDVWNRIDFAAEHCDIEGVTFLGGEPFLQARGLSELARLSRQRGLTVMVFTGYCIEGLRADPLPGAAELLEHTDLLVDGPYVASLADEERNWAGSSNQRFHFLTDRYRPGVEWDHAWANGLEVRVGLDGSIRGNGWPNGFSSSV
jgi:anaerobic ribonucleoside-triphosphate reductase activating protein